MNSTLAEPYGSLSPRHAGWIARFCEKKYASWAILAMIWLMALVTFSLPGRMTASVDAVALLKLAIRFSILGGTAVFTVYLSFSHYRRSRDFSIISQLAPWFVYLLWAGASITWSSLKSYSISQYIGLSAQLALAWSVAHVFYNVDDVFRLLRHINRILLLYSFVLLVCHAVAPETSGLRRDVRLTAADGLVHPTAAGATASLGLLMAVALGILRRERHSVTWSAIAVQTVMLLVAQSRSAMLSDAVVLPLAIGWLAGRRWLGAILLAVSAAMVAFLIIDPGFDLTRSAIDTALDFVRRGQTAEQLAEGSGRMELWLLVIDEFRHSPIIGHGYFLTSQTGYLHVWRDISIQDAHNVVLQILSGTGVIGLLILTWAGWKWLIGVVSLLMHPRPVRDVAKTMMLVAVWYAVWGMGCTTFMGPVRPESVVFFAMLGAMIGLYAHSKRQSAAMERHS